MLSKVEAGKKTAEGSGSGKLLKEIDTISKALYLDRSSSKKLLTAANARPKSSGKTNLPDSKSNSKGINEDPSRKDKKSIWNWRPLKALSHIRNRRFNCCFSLQVHLIEGLPSTFDDTSLCVYWKRRDGVLATRPAKVVEHTAKFEEKLTYTCSVYGSRNGPHHSAKYEAKHFLLYASVAGAAELDLGKHRVDLTRLLPLTLEELEEEKSSGKWTTSFRLSGMARGAVLNVSFGYMVVGDNSSATRDNHNAPNASTLRQNSLGLTKPDTKSSQGDGKISMVGDNSSATRDNHNAPNASTLRQNSLGLTKPDAKTSQGDGKISMMRIGSLPSFSGSYSSRVVDEVKDLHEVLPTSTSELTTSIDILYHKLDEEKTCSRGHDKPELDVLRENLEPNKPDAHPLSDPGKGNSEDCEGNGEITSNPVKDKPELNVFQGNLEPAKSNVSPSHSRKENPEECEGNEFSVVDQGIELSSDEPVKEEESSLKTVDASHVDSTCTIDIAVIKPSSEDSVEHESLDVDNDSSKEKAVVHENTYEDNLCTKEILMKELESALNSVSDLEMVALESPNEEKYMEAKSEHKLRKSHSLDDVTESVASEFLSMLGMDHSSCGLSSESEPDSPRERLLRQFEKEALAEGFSLYDFDIGNEGETDGGYNASIGPEKWNFSEGLNDISSLLKDLQDGPPVESQEARSKERAKMLEDLETEALMREWGLNEKAFLHSPPKNSPGFGSPIDLPPEDSPTLPPLGEGLGPFLQTKDGGFLRSMNSSLFGNANGGGNLVMQVSNPVVVPAEMGSGIMEILQGLASVGIEKLSMQANKLMPLEDITGKTMQQVAWEAMPVLDGAERQCFLPHDFVTGQDATASVQGELKGASSGSKSDKFGSSSVSNQTGSEFVSLEDLAPLAMDKIEALSIEGLRIQSGMSDVDAPSNIIAQSIGDISALQGKGVNSSGSLGLDGAAGLQLLDIKDNGDSVDGIMDLSLTLDEWIRLDSGEIDDMDNISEHTSRILAAHHAYSFDLIRGSSKGERKRGKGSGRKCGLLGNNFTVALMVQLRDPLRDYEPVGTPMLSLIQVERVFLPMKPKIYTTVFEVRENNEENDESETVVKVKDDKKEEKSNDDEGIPQYKINEVHVAGLKTEPRKTKLWGTSSQQQSGSRWLLANGMGKNKNPIVKSKMTSKSGAPATTKVLPGDTLWSISSRVLGTGARWK